jgi:hypothetical protein
MNDTQRGSAQIALDDIENELMTIEGIARCLLAMSEAAGDYESAFNFLGSALFHSHEAAHDAFHRAHDAVMGEEEKEKAGEEPEAAAT